MRVRACDIPTDGLLQAYAQRAGCYTDCFELTYPGPVDLGALIAAFYTTWLFRLERIVLTLTQKRRIQDAEVAALASGAADRFAVWRVEGRSDTQILLSDLSGRTRSFLAVQETAEGSTILVFGSAVVPEEGQPLPVWARVLLPLHRFYSRALLFLAARKIRQR